MKLSSVFSKTPKGIDEVSTRASHLPFRVRAMLIMVDGHRTGRQLLAMSPSNSEGKRHLVALVDGGFIQVETAPVRATKADPSTRATLADDDISLAKNYAVLALEELLGSKATALAAEIEKASSAGELKQQIEKLRVALSHAVDQEKATQFLEKLTLALD